MEVDTVIQKAHDRLKRVTIEQLDFEPLITRYDRDYTLFYLDPPYRTPSSQTYAMALTDDDYRRLAVLLESLEGKFLLSLNDDEFIRKVFGRFDIQTIQTRYSVMKNATKPVNELIIKNY